MHSINETILYGAQGVCRVTAITEKNYDGKNSKYYALKPIYDESSTTIFVPLENKTLTAKMRRVLSTDEIYELIRSIPDETTIWIENENERRDRYKEILRSGNRENLIRLIKTLYLHEQSQKENGKKLHATDEYFFKEAEKMLYDEFAHVLCIKRDQVLPFIFHQIQVEQRP